MTDQWNHTRPTPVSGAQHRIRLADYEAVVASVGASLRQLRYQGRDLVVPFEADELRPVYSGATLIPWPNRVVDGRYEFGGAQHQLALTEPTREHALHGLGAWLNYDCLRHSSDEVVLGATIEPQDGYPWRLRVETVFVLDRDGLSQTVRATNLSKDPAPFGLGAHHYLTAGPGQVVDDWTLTLPARKVLLNDDRLVPIGLADTTIDAERFDFERPRPLGPTQLDHAFTGLRFTGSRVQARLTSSAGTGVMISWDERCRWVQIYTADQAGGASAGRHRTGLAVEPMTCAPAAFNHSTDAGWGLISIDPLAKVEATWTISALG